jgi:hypothetical protein
MVNPLGEVNLITPFGLTKKEIWHKWLGHFHKDGFYQMIQFGVLIGLPLVRFFDRACVCCLHGKQSRIKFLKAIDNRAIKTL